MPSGEWRRAVCCHLAVFSARESQCQTPVRPLANQSRRSQIGRRGARRSTGRWRTKPGRSRPACWLRWVRTDTRARSSSRLPCTNPFTGQMSRRRVVAWEAGRSATEEDGLAGEAICWLMADGEFAFSIGDSAPPAFPGQAATRRMADGERVNRAASLRRAVIAGKRAQAADHRRKLPRLGRAGRARGCRSA